jgi:hypothetical protein
MFASASTILSFHIPDFTQLAPPTHMHYDPELLTSWPLENWITVCSSIWLYSIVGPSLVKDFNLVSGFWKHSDASFASLLLFRSTFHNDSFEGKALTSLFCWHSLWTYSRGMRVCSLLARFSYSQTSFLTLLLSTTWISHVLISFIVVWYETSCLSHSSLNLRDLMLGMSSSFIPFLPCL